MHRRTAPPRLPLIALAVLVTTHGLMATAAVTVDSRVTEALVERGKYVSLAADCGSCHLKPGGQAFAGGTPLKSPFGILYGPNITQDAETGIGHWTKADFVNALRNGIRKDGAYLYPAMPYDAYTKMTTADMDALWAYMQSVPAVRNVPPANTLPFPLTIRDGLAVWQRLYFSAGPFIPAPDRDQAWNRGAYLVQALAHCSDCHTPRNFAQGPDMSHLLAGAEIEGWYAPDISNDAQSVLHPWTEAELASYLKSGVAPDNAKAFGPMQEAVHDSLQFLRTEDLVAIAHYLKNQPGSRAPEPRAAVRWSGTDAGKQVFDDNCASCHGSDGKGRADSIPALAGNSALTAREPYNAISAVLEGFAPQASWGPMASFATTLTDEQIADVVNYVRVSWGNQGSPNATAWIVRTWRRNGDAPTDESHELLCPSLSADAARPALAATPAALRRAANDPAGMALLVAAYRSARPHSTRGEIVEALSEGYCRVVAADRVSTTRLSAELEDYAQRIAVAVEAR